ncbi:MAG: proline--tRNA ligase, partial [Syntrophobacteria bacterium]
KTTGPREGLAEKVTALLDDIQRSLYERALHFREENSHSVDDYQSFKEIVAERSGLLYAHWCGRAECEDRIKQETMATVRCIPLVAEGEGGLCVRCGRPSRERVCFAKAY